MPKSKKCLATPTKNTGMPLGESWNGDQEAGDENCGGLKKHY
jgi:hypothetical protein